MVLVDKGGLCNIISHSMVRDAGKFGGNVKVINNVVVRLEDARRYYINVSSVVY